MNGILDITIITTIITIIIITITITTYRKPVPMPL